MPKYYCDYCDIFLTHDSPSVRKSHNEGWKHKAAVRAYYSQFEEDHAQQLIDQKLKEYEWRMGRGGPPPVPFGMNAYMPPPGMAPPPIPGMPPPPIPGMGGPPPPMGRGIPPFFPPGMPGQ